MTAQDWTTLGSTIGGVLGFAFAIIQTFRKRGNDDARRLAEVKDEIIRVEKDACESWKKRFETEHAEYSEYRVDVHNRLNKAQELVLRLTNDNGELRAKTDMTPILAHQKQQGEINIKIIQSLDLLVEKLVQSKDGYDKK